MQRIAKFAGQTGEVDPAAVNGDRTGVSYPEYGAGVLRLINHVRTGPAGPTALPDLGRAGEILYRGVGKLLRSQPLIGAFGHRKPITEYVRQRYAGVFVDSNRRLREMVGPDLPMARYQGID